MEITTIGAALEFVGQLEEMAKKSHTRAMELAQTGNLKNTLAAIADGNFRRQAVLKRLYDDNVYSDMDTGVLAPIPSMTGEGYTPSDWETKTATDRELLERALEIERMLQKTYNDLSSRLQSGPRHILRRIDKLSQELRAGLASLEALRH